MCMRNLLAYPEERVFFKDRDSRFLLVSVGFLASLAHGRPLDEVIGKTDFDIFSRTHAVAAFEDEKRVIETGEPMLAKVERETFHDRPDAWVSTTKLPLLGAGGEIIGTWGISRDVTAQVTAEQALVHQALHDTVTGLANRVALMDHLTQALVALERRPGSIGLLFIDLDDFKEVNDSWGHDAGDCALIEVGRRLTAVARRTDTVARLGGDEFVLLCAHLDDDDDLRLISDRVVRAIRAPLTIAGVDLTVTGSLGVVRTADPHLDPGELLRRADVALYDAKHAGRNRFEVFDAKIHLGAESTAGLAGELALAIERSELFVLYQPLFRLDDGALIGAEALVRWRHPQRGVLLPGEFIAHAERRGLIEQVDSFVLDEACRQLAAWGSGDDPWDDFMISVNVSGRQLREPWTGRPGFRCARAPPDHAVATVPGDHRDRIDRRTRRRQSGARVPVGARRASRARRLRNRLLDTRTPAATARRHPQDRPQLHRADRGRIPRPQNRRRRHRDGTRTRHDRRRRGHRDPRPAERTHRARL